MLPPSHSKRLRASRHFSSVEASPHSKALTLPPRARKQQEERAGGGCGKRKNDCFAHATNTRCRFSANPHAQKSTFPPSPRLRRAGNSEEARPPHPKSSQNAKTTRRCETLRTTATANPAFRS